MRTNVSSDPEAHMGRIHHGMNDAHRIDEFHKIK